MRVRALLLVLALAGCDKDTPAPAPPSADKQLLAGARDLAVKADLEGAHAKILQIPLESPMRVSNDAMEIETRWGQARIANSDAEKDSEKRAGMLREVANASDVAPEVRTQAANKLALIESEPKLPDLLSHYDPKAAEANLEKGRLLFQDKKMKESRDLLYPRVTGGIGSPDELEMLVATCALSKDKPCLLKLEELGLARQGTSEEAMRPEKKSAPLRDH